MPYSFSELEKIAEYAESSGLFGGRGQKITKAQAMLRLLRGQEIGLPPTSALGGIWFSNGKMVLDAGTVAFLLAQGGYEISATTDNKACSMVMLRQGKEVGSAEYTIEEAKQAGLIREQSAWKTFPADMLWARCITRLARRYAPEVFGGAVYTPGEIPDDDHPQEKPVPQMVAPKARGEDLAHALAALKERAVGVLGLDPQVVRASLLRWAGVARVDALSVEKVQEFYLQHYEGFVELVTMLRDDPRLESLRQEHGCYGNIPWDTLAALAPVQEPPRQDGDAAANELFGTEHGLVRNTTEQEEDLPI